MASKDDEMMELGNSTDEQNMTEPELQNGTSSSVLADDNNAAAAATLVVPQLTEDGITYGDLDIAIKVLNAVSKLNKKNKKKKKNSKKKKRKVKDGDDTTGTSNANSDDENEDDDNNNIDDGLIQYKERNLRPFRKALANCLEIHTKFMYDGKNELQYYQEQKQNRTLKRQKTAEKDLQKNYINTTILRQTRIEKLKLLQNDSKNEELIKLKQYMIPDGHVDTTCNNDMKLLIENYDDKDSTTTTKLPCLRSCYVCKVRYRELHTFYDQLCPMCAAMNWEKRIQTCNLNNKIAIVTGSRVKIGYQTCLKLLRSGCTVIATTRFPNTAIQTYRNEIDFNTFQHRLHIYGLDLRDMPGIEAFTRYIKQKYNNINNNNGIDILINNACQTIRRPAGYYRPILEKEQQLWTNGDSIHKSMLQNCIEFEQLRRRIVLDHKQQQQQQQHNNNNDNNKSSNYASTTTQLLPEPTTITDISNNGEKIHNNTATSVIGDSTTTAITKEIDIIQQITNVENTAVMAEHQEKTPFELTGLSHSAMMSQMVILPEDAGVNHNILPPGLSDINGQQLDLRTMNSWLLKMEDVSTCEVMECMFINAIAPFVLNSRLIPLMKIPENDDNRPDRYIINVSAMEGKFYRYKTECHPHTNMAKASLNMLTRTSAENLAKKHRIYMNSVDTGWINDENPLERANKTAKNNNFQTPIDEIDAAARILDPIFSSVNNSNNKEYKQIYGKFLKDYKESEW